MKKKIKIKNTKLIFVIFIMILCILALCYYNFVFYSSYAKNLYTNQVVKMAEQNENPIFKVHKIMLYSGANAIDKSENETLKDLSICQYTDIAIYIDNTSSIYDITNENTVKELYIDNIQITPNSNLGHQYINYKNALDFAKYKDIEEPDNNRIDYTIVSTNEQNENNDYSNPTFYTDCSNPITLEYMNKDIVTNYSVSNNSATISFNGKILQEAGLNLKDLSCALSFNINLVNNLNELFVCNVKLNIILDNGNDNNISKGYLYESNTVSGSDYEFLKVGSNRKIILICFYNKRSNFKDCFFYYFIVHHVLQVFLLVFF